MIWKCLFSLGSDRWWQKRGPSKPRYPGVSGVTPSNLRLNRWGTIFSLRDQQTRHHFYISSKRPDLEQISQKTCELIFTLSHIFATQARWRKFGFLSAFKLNRLSGLTDPGSNIKSEKRSITASFLFSQNLQSYSWSGRSCRAKHGGAVFSAICVKNVRNQLAIESLVDCSTHVIF